MKKITVLLLIFILTHMLVCGFAFALETDNGLIVKSVSGTSEHTPKYGFEDKNGNTKLPYTYDYAEPFSCGYALVSLGKKTYFIDENNRPAFGSDKSGYTFYYSFREDLCVASKDGKFGFIDKYGSVAIDFAYDDAYSFSEGLACVYKNGKAGFINKKGEVAIDFLYDSADGFKDGYAKVNRGGRFGFINTVGGRGTAIMYEKAADLCEGLVCVRIDGKYTYVNADGFIYFPPVFDEAGSFSNGSALIKLGGKYGRIRKDGTFQIERVFDYLSEFEGSYAVAGKYIYEDVMQYGFVDADGNRVTPVMYDKIMYYDGVYMAQKDGKAFYFDRELNTVSKPDEDLF